MKKNVLTALGAIAAILVVAAIAVLPRLERLAPAPAAIGGPFSLTDHTGRAVTDQDFRGKPMLIYFGYAYCPDVCPTSLATMAAALDKLGPKADKLTPLFITVDPERDTVETIDDYVAAFHPRLVGLTGTPEQVAEVAKAYKVYYKKAPNPGGEGYTMDHSSVIYLMDAEGRFLTHFAHGTSPEAMAEGLAKHLD